MDRTRFISQRTSLIGCPYRGMDYQCGHGVKGDEFQEGHGVKGDEFQLGHGVKGDEFQLGHGVKGDEFQQGHGRSYIMTMRNRRFRVQNGSGGWGWLGRIASRALPFLTRGAKAVGKHALSTITDQTLNTSMRFLDDVLDGGNVLDSAKQRLLESGDELRNAAKAKVKEGGLNLARTVRRKLVERAADGAQQQQGAGRGVTRKRGVAGAGRCCSITKKRKTNPYRNLFD
jgi:hypothetical protein